MYIYNINNNMKQYLICLIVCYIILASSISNFSRLRIFYLDKIINKGLNQ